MCIVHNKYMNSLKYVFTPIFALIKQIINKRYFCSCNGINLKYKGGKRMSKIRVAIIFGGVSNEYETSLSAAAAVIENINNEEYETVCIGITRKGRWLYYPGASEDILNDTWSENPDCTPVVISPDPNRNGIIKLENGEASFFKVDVIFPLLYGKNGEDGTIAGLLRVTGIPYVGSDLIASAACMDKTYTRMVLGYNNVKTSKWKMMFRNELNMLDEKCNEFCAELAYPIIVKPANFGSSKSVNKASDFETLKNAIKIALAQDDKVVVEEFVEGKELQIAVLGYDHLVISVPGEVVVKRDDFDFNSMFSEPGCIVPALLENGVSETLRQLSGTVYKLMGCVGMARMDFYYTNDGEIVISQINTVPEFTENSMYVKLMEKQGFTFEELIGELITQAIDNYEGKSV